MLGRKPKLPAGRQRLRGDSMPPARQVNKTFSYSSRRSEAVLNTGRQLQRDIKDSATKGARYGLQRIGVIVLIAAALVSAVNVLSLSSQVKIEPLADGGQDIFLRSQQDYASYVSQELKDSIWNNNKVTVDTNKISGDMLEEFPELSSASITVPLLAKRPIVYVQPADPALVLIARNGSFVISDSGKALLRANDTADIDQPDLPVIKDLSVLKLEVGHQALPAANVAFIRNVLAQLAAAKVSVSSITLPANASELDIQPAGQAYMVKFNLQSDKPRQQAGTYLAAIQSLQRKGITPAKYIDVRVDGRAYYQ